MQIANYNNTTTASGGSGKYPLSTQSLDFIQQQILLLQQLSIIGGANYILAVPDGQKTGIVVIKGEVIVLAATPTLSSQINFIAVTTTVLDVDADGEKFLSARTVRTAAFSATKTTEETYEIGKFEILESNSTLSAKVKQMPTTVLNFLSDILAEKLPSLQKNGLTQSQIDGLRVPCILNCTASISTNQATNYSLLIKLVGSKVLQEQTLMDNSKFIRTFDGVSWSEWTNVSNNMHLEVKIVRGTVLLRHGQLSDDTKIILLRKKKRSKFRRTGGVRSYAKNLGRREPRQPKMQYVHFKGVVLSKGKPGEWYVPRCIAVMDQGVDNSIIGKEISSICQSLVIQKANDVNGNPVYHIQGVRNKIGVTNGNYKQHHGYAQVAIQAARYNGNGGKDQGGEMVQLKYRLCRKKIKYTSESLNYVSWVYYRTFSIE